MGFLDDRIDELQQGVDDLAPGDEVRRNRQILLAILEALGEDPEDTSYWEDTYEPLPPGETRDQSDTATYTSRPLTATTTLQDVDIGFRADTLAFRNVSDDLAIHMKDPYQSDHSEILIEPGDAPFVVSGVWGIETRKVWWERGPNATADFDFDLFATKAQRGGG